VPTSGHTYDGVRLTTFVGPVLPTVLNVIAALQLLSAAGYWLGLMPTLSRDPAVILAVMALIIMAMGWIVRYAAEHVYVGLAGAACVGAVSILSAGLCLDAYLTDLRITIALPYCAIVAVGATSFWLQRRHFIAGQIGVFVPPLVLLLVTAPTAVEWSFSIQMSAVAMAASTGMYVLTRRTSMRAFRLASELEHRATYDGLTGVLNRATWIDRAGQRLAADQHVGRSTWCLFVDLDDFKGINDTWGHDAGDEILGLVSDVLRQCAEGAHLVGRFGGDEFVMLMPDTSHFQAAAMVERIHRALRALRGGETRISASIGLATSTPTDTLAMLMQRADLAMLDIKALTRAVSEDDGRSPNPLAVANSAATA
jgi:diguanylate cyclase (GGDEF)-like protein